MSKYTTEIRFICESMAGLKDSTGYANVKDIINLSAPKVFDFDFPIFDPAYRLPLETKILRHFYTREIGFETVGLFKLKLETKLNEIMPYYNQLYESALIKFNPMYNVDMERTYNKKNEGLQVSTGNIKADDVIDMTGNENQKVDHESDSTSTSDGTNHTTLTQIGTNAKEKRDLFSDTPQGALTGVENGDYLTDARKITDSENVNSTNTTVGTSGDTTDQSTTAKDTMTGERSSNTKGSHNTDTESNSSVNNLEDYTEVVKGKQGFASYSALLKEFRETFLNIDMLVISELSDLFFLLY